MKARLLFALGALSLASLSGCGRAERSNEGSAPECTCTGDPVVDKALVAFLSKARAVHHEADAALDAGDPKKAITVLRSLVSGPRPRSGQETAPEVLEVVADTHARLADLESEAGDFDAAQKDVDLGLALAQKPTHFRGHLFEIRGIVLEREAKASKEKGDLPGAVKAATGAVEAFEQAIKIQDQVITEALGNAGKR